jgi:methyltransferase-like protein
MMGAAGLPEEMVKVLREKAAIDIVLKEQYLDFFRCRGFRQTLLCHAEAELTRNVGTERMRQFRYAGNVPRADEPDARPGVVAFKHENGSAIRTDNPMTIAALDAMRGAWPRSIPFEELAHLAGADTDAQVQAFAGSLLQMFGVGLIDLRLFEPAIVTGVSERPAASPWARLGAGPQGVANLYHDMVELSDAASALLALADGTRTVDELAAACNLPRAEAEEGLRVLARLALLVA